MTRSTLILLAVIGAHACSVAGAKAQAPAPALAPALKMAVVVRVDGPGALSPTGQPALSSDAALSALDRELRDLAQAGVAFTLSISPVLIDELLVGERTDVYASVLSLAGRHALLTEPYAHALLPHLKGSAAVAAELEKGTTSLQHTMQTAPLSITDPPGLALSDEVLRGVTVAGVGAVLASAETVGASPLQSRGVTLIPAVPLPSGNAPAQVLFGRYGAGARIAAIARVRPGLADTLRALQSDRRVALVGLSEIAKPAAPQRIAFELPAPPPKYYADDVAQADDAVRGFQSYTLPQNPTAKVLGVLLARSRSTADWQQNWGLGSERANAIVELADVEQSLQSASDGSVTLTSRRGTVPVTVDNRATYPVRVRVRVTSPKLTFPRGDARVVTIPPHGDTITFEAEARSTGSFPMTVRLTSPNGRVDFASGKVVVRSTAANVLALVLTLSGALFLVAWSSRDFIRRRIARRRR
jgi:hypothetical protein